MTDNTAAPAKQAGDKPEKADPALLASASPSRPLASVAFKEEVAATKRQLEEERAKTSLLQQGSAPVARKTNEELQKLKSEIALLRQEVGMSDQATKPSLHSSASSESIPTVKEPTAGSAERSTKSERVPRVHKRDKSQKSPRSKDDPVSPRLAVSGSRPTIDFKDDVTTVPRLKVSKDDLEVKMSLESSESPPSSGRGFRSGTIGGPSELPVSGSASTRRRKRDGRTPSTEAVPFEKSQSTAHVPKQRTKTARSTSVKEAKSSIRHRSAVPHSSSQQPTTGHKRTLSEERDLSQPTKSLSSSTSPPVSPNSTLLTTPKSRGAHNALWLLARQVTSEKDGATSQDSHSDDEGDQVKTDGFEAERRKSTADSESDNLIKGIRKKIESKSKKASNRDILASVRQSTGSNTIVIRSSPTAVRHSPSRLTDSSTAAAVFSVEAGESSNVPPHKLEKANTGMINRRPPLENSPSGVDFNVKKRLVLQKDQSTGTLSIRGATISELVRQLVNRSSESDLDKNRFLQTFLLTYQSFMTALELFQRLSEHFVKADNKTVQIRVIEFFLLWLDERFQDFFNGEDEVSLHLQTFITTQIAIVFPDDAAKVNFALDEKRLLFRKRFKKQIEADPVVKKSTGNKDLLSYKHAAVAVEITYQLSELFQRIEPLEFIQKKSAASPSKISELIQKFNQVSMWMQTEIVKQENLAKRAKMLIHIIKMALDCQEVQNYDATAAILAALHSAAIFRLKQTWAKAEEEKPKLLQNLRSLEGVVSSEDNYKQYRQLIANVKPPAIPLIGVYLKDITFINDGNPDTLEKDFGKPTFVNFNKREKLANVLLEIRKFQTMPYAGKRIPVLRTLVGNPEVMTEDQIWAASQAVEAKAAKK